MEHRARLLMGELSHAEINVLTHIVSDDGVHRNCAENMWVCSFAASSINRARNNCSSGFITRLNCNQGTKI